ncbi:GNAT family N-acetyltransferase [Rufibacter sediminis]|uniref:GNAT family N-acetyltransferase n=1 Tax=Rufibacter sediminis TaxID=2762756 RepID=A0ABR6VUK4_9BACT|nr:GNAT family N-acetyltransferase [Rufibacter sediminis]MBC3540850.1 GNAT family N-acetyltransferase [Rufibacter sediminis]
MPFPIPYPEADKSGFFLSFDKDLLQLETIHGFLRQVYWSKDIPRQVVKRAIDHSLCVGVYFEGKQVAFARLITDYTTFAYLCDVFVLEDYRGNGLSKWMIKAFRAHPELQKLRRWMLATQDAHDLYSQFGFEPLPHPERFMQLHSPDVYQRQPQRTEEV